MSAQRRMSRREFLWASAIGSAGVAVAACQPAAMPATDMADEGDGDAPAMEAVEIRFSHWHGGFWDPIRDGISEEHPEITAISESTPWGEYSTKLLTQMVGGVAPDVVMVGSIWQGEWFKVLLALDDALDAHGVDNSKWDADPWMQCGNDGKIYSLSQVYCPNWQLVVNRTLAEEAGIDLPDWGDDGPAANYDEWRWDDLVELLKATTKVNSAGEVEQWGLANSTGGFGATALYFMYSNGAQALDDLWGYQETEALVDSEESVQALQAYIDLTLVDKVAPTPAEAKAVQGGLFNGGKAFCSIRHPGVGDQRVNQEAFGLLFMPVPWREHRVQMMGTNSWACGAAARTRTRPRRLRSGRRRAKRSATGSRPTSISPATTCGARSTSCRSCPRVGCAASTRSSSAGTSASPTIRRPLRTCSGGPGGTVARRGSSTTP